MDDDEEKVVQSAQSPENLSAQAKEEATSVASGSTSENNEVEIASPVCKLLYFQKSVDVCQYTQILCTVTMNQ